METQKSSESVVTVDVHAANNLIRSGYRYLDVRTVEEFKKGHLENAFNVPYMLFTPEGRVTNPQFLEQVSLIFNKEDHLIVGCQSGVRSLQASADLLSADFKHVKNMAGGYAAWVENGFGMKKPEDELNSCCRASDGTVWDSYALPSSSVMQTCFATQSRKSSEPVVSVDWLHVNLRDPNVKVLDASWYMPDEQRNPVQEYQAAHIPGALFFDLDGISDRATCLPHMLPSKEAFAAAVSALGIQKNDMVIVYDGKGIFSAARVWWMFRVFGHDMVWVLDGGFPCWLASGYEVESTASEDAMLKAEAANQAVERVYQGQNIDPITFHVKFQAHLVWTLEQVKQNIQDRKYLHLDARSKARFDGLAPEPRKGVRSGHIPGSKCFPFTQMLNGSQTLLPADELSKKFKQEGISLDLPVVTSCGTGVTACIVALGLHRLGRTDVPVYDGSWTEWEANFELPILTAA